MSPVFDSISKEGYTSAFTPAEIKSCIDDGTINDRVIALGGICKDNIPQVKEWNFGGVAILGDVWQYKDDINQFKSHIEELADLIKT